MIKGKFLEPYIGKQIRLRLNVLGINIKEGAKRCNIHYTAFHRLLTKNQDPTVSTIQRVAKGLKTTVDYLLNCERNVSSFTADEHELLETYRGCTSDDVKRKIREVAEIIAKHN